MSLHMSHVANLLHVQTIHLCHHSILADAKSIQKLPKAILAAIWSTYQTWSKMIKHDKDMIKKAHCATEHCTFPQTVASCCIMLHHVASCCIMLHHACVAWTQFCPFWPRPRPRPHVSWSQMPEAKVRSPLNILKQSDTEIYKVWFYQFRICEFEFAPVDWQIVSFHRYWQTRHVAEAMTWLFHWPFHSLLHWPFQSPFHWYSPSPTFKVISQSSRPDIHWHSTFWSQWKSLPVWKLGFGGAASSQTFCKAVFLCLCPILNFEQDFSEP